MPIYEVMHLYKPNGNRISRPMVATSAEEAIDLREGELEIAADDPHFEVTVREIPDPDGSYEALLREAERRRWRDDF